VLKSKPISLEIWAMLLFSVGLHLSIILSLVWWAKASSNFNIPKNERLDFLWVTPIERSKLKDYQNKLPPPAVVVAEQPKPKEVERPRVVEKNEARKTTQKSREEKPQKNEKEEKRKEIAKALSDIYSALANKPAPKPDNYNLKDYRQGVGVSGSGPVSLDPELDKEILIYRKNIQAVLINNWYIINKAVLKQLKDPVVILTIKIDNQGNIVSQKFEKSSGNSYYDKSVERAIEKSSPLPPPPEKLANEVLIEGIVIEFNPGL
jgi:colicin import membrane protein